MCAKRLENNAVDAVNLKEHSQCHILLQIFKGSTTIGRMCGTIGANLRDIFAGLEYRTEI